MSVLNEQLSELAKKLAELSAPNEQPRELAKKLGRKPGKAELADIAVRLTEIAHEALRRPPLPDPEWITYRMAVRLGSCSEGTVRRAVRRGFVVARRFGSRNVRINLASWREFLADGPGERIRPPNNPTPRQNGDAP